MAFEQFMLDARGISGLGTTHQTYTMVQGVFQAFRRRLDVKEAIRFANVLPPVLRALFIADWNLDEPRRPFTDRPTMTREVQALRPDHNLAPDSSIGNVAAALRKNIDQVELDRVLASLPPGALAFWQVD